MAIKLQLDCDEDLWKQVLIYKITNGLNNNNETVLELLKKGLKK